MRTGDDEYRSPRRVVGGLAEDRVGRVEALEVDRPERPVRKLVAAVVIGALVLLEIPLSGCETGFHLLVPDAAWRQLVLLTMVNVVIALSLNVINGMAGQFSIGHAGFVGIGAYTAAIVAGHMHAAFEAQRQAAGLPTLGTADIPLQSSFLIMPAAIVSAIEDALRPFGVRIAQTPVTPARLVELIAASR